MSVKGRIPDEAQLADPATWDEASAEDVQPRPSGMVVFSLRLPQREFRVLKEEADHRQTTMSELVRTAVRFYLMPGATATLSMTAFHNIQVTSFTPAWSGGLAGPVAVTGEHATPTPPLPLGNVVPRLPSGM